MTCAASGVPPFLPQAPTRHEDDLQALLTHLEASPAHVVGLSMGGRMALRFAACHPASLRSLVLADTALDGNARSEDWQARWKGICEAAAGGRIAEAKQQWLDHPLFLPARRDPETQSQLARMVEDYSGWHWHNSDPARVPTPSLASRLGEIRIPTLVIVGANDLPDFLNTGELLARNLPDARHRTRQEMPGTW